MTDHLWLVFVPIYFVLTYVTGGLGVVALHLIGFILVTVACHAWTRWQENRMPQDDPQYPQKRNTP